MVIFSKNKRGWIKITEAILGILMLTGLLLVLYDSRSNVFDEEEKLSEYMNDILLNIAENETLRSFVIADDVFSLEDFVSQKFATGINFSVQVCNFSKTQGCVDSGVPTEDKQVYTEERIIGSTLEEYNPKILRLYVWF